MFKLLEKVTRYAETLNETYFDVSVRPRRAKHLFNIEAFKEAWVNACVHNNWVEKRPPAVFWFDDRLEIMSYGGIPKGMAKEDFLKGKTNPVNEGLMSIFLQCDIVEHSGHGVPIVVREYGEKAYEFSQSFITVTIPFDRTGFNTDNVAQNVAQKDEQIKAIIRANNRITRKEIAANLGVSVKTVERFLKENSTIHYVGSSKSGHWEIEE